MIKVDWTALMKRERAASTVTYGLVVGLVAVLSIGAVQRVGGGVTELFGGVATVLAGGPQIVLSGQPQNGRDLVIRVTGLDTGTDVTAIVDDGDGPGGTLIRTVRAASPVTLIFVHGDLTGEFGANANLTVEVTAVLEGKTVAEATLSALLSPEEVPEAPANTVLPAISGTARQGEELSATTGTWTGAPTPRFSYQWRRDGSDIAGATSPTHILAADDVGATITVEVTATNSEGSEVAESPGLVVLNPAGYRIVTTLQTSSTRDYPLADFPGIVPGSRMLVSTLDCSRAATCRVNGLFRFKDGDGGEFVSPLSEYCDTGSEAPATNNYTRTIPANTVTITFQASGASGRSCGPVDFDVTFGGN